MVAAETTGFSVVASILTRAQAEMLMGDFKGLFEFVVVATGNRRQDHREWFEIHPRRVITPVRNSELFRVPRNQLFQDQRGYLHHVDNTINHNFAHENRDFYVVLTDDSKREMCKIVNRNPFAPGGNNGILNLSETMFSREVTVTVGARVDGGNVSGHIVNVSPNRELVFSCPV
jgi:hypothetical protein